MARRLNTTLPKPTREQVKRMLGPFATPAQVDQYMRKYGKGLGRTMAKRKKRRSRRGLGSPSPAFVAAEKACNKHLTNSKFKACMRTHGYWLH